MNKFYGKTLFEINKLNISSEYYEFSLQKYKSIIDLNPIITLNKHFESKSGLLANIPIDIKDNITTKDILTSGGSKILSNYIPPFNSTVVEKLLHEGAHIFSKSNLEELGQGGIGNNDYYGDVLNPFNKDLIPGGSSSGAACLVASGVVPVAIGTDTGDSIRQPASCCGIIGYKPSWGSISRYGVIPYAPSLDTVGIFARCIEDIAYVFDILSGKDYLDLTSIECERKIFDEINKFNSNKKILFFTNINNKLKNEEYIKLFDSAVARINNKNFKIYTKTFNEQLFDHLLFTYKVISNSESISCCSNLTGLTFGNRQNADNWQKMFIKTRTLNFGKKVKSRLLLGLFSTDKEHQTEILQYYQKIRTLIKKEIDKYLNHYDYIIMPFQEYGAKSYKSFERKSIVRKKTDYIDDNLLFANISGVPSIMIPIGYLKNNIPVSLSIMSKYKNDKSLLQFAKYFESKINFEYRLANE